MSEDDEAEGETEMPAKTAEQIAAQLGIPVDQVRDVIAFADAPSATGGTTKTYNLYGDDIRSPQWRAERKAFLEAEQAELTARWQARAAERTAATVSEPSDEADSEPAQGNYRQLTDRLRKGQNRPTLTGRTLRRHEQRAQARTEQRPGRPVIGHHDRAIVAARNTNAGLMTAGEYLRGIGFPEADVYASAFGRAVAKAYRANRNAEPQRIYAVANGRIRRSQFGYHDAADLLAGAWAYSRTAEFLAAEQNTVDIRILVNA